MTVSSSFLIFSSHWNSNLLWRVISEFSEKMMRKSYTILRDVTSLWLDITAIMMAPKATHVSGYWVLTKWYRHSLIGCNFGSHRDPTPGFCRIIGWETRFIYRKIWTNLKWRSSRGQRSKVKVNCHLMKYCSSNVVLPVIWKSLISWLFWYQVCEIRSVGSWDTASPSFQDRQLAQKSDSP